MKAIKVTSLLLCALAVGGCDVRNEKLVGPYVLVAIDTESQMSVSYDVGGGASVGRILPVVFSVGWDDRYIVAKQHPGEDRSVTNFYFLEIAKDAKYGDQFKAVTGPLTERQFLAAKATLRLPDFRKTIKSLE